MASASLELRGPASALLDEPLDLRPRGAGGAGVAWRARLRDDDGRVWRATAGSAAALDGAWAPAKAGPAVAALASLRPVAVEVRAEAEDGRAATRTVARQLVAEGVRLRRWRGNVAGTLHLPAGPPTATLLVPASRDAPAPGAVRPAADASGLDVPGGGTATGTVPAVIAATLAAPLLASRGVLVLVLARGDEERARELLAAVPGAGDARVAVPPLPPGVPAAPSGDGAAWDALLAALSARPRR